MTTSFAFLFFGTLIIAAVVGMAKIQRQELLEAREKKAQDKARIDAFRG